MEDSTSTSSKILWLSRGKGKLPLMGSIRRTFAILATFMITAVILFLSYTGDVRIITQSKPMHLKLIQDKHGFVLNTIGCRIPEWDPYDPSILPFFEKIDGPYQCPGKPYFFIGKPNATVALDENVLSLHYGAEKDNLSCTYKPIHRDPGPEKGRTDSKFTFGEPKPMKLNVPLEEEFIQITCSPTHIFNFTQYMALVPLKDKVEERTAQLTQNQTSQGLNIIIVGLDSVSKLNFLRHFPKSHRFITENFSPIDLKGYTKVADNTFVNLVPLLTGHFVDYYWNESLRNMFFDDLDFVWKNYSSRGYRTLFAEDAPNIATFNYLKKGFLNPPADYYFRPFALAVERSKMKEISRTYCFHTELETDVIYRYLKHFVSTMGQRPFFAFTFVARLTHDRLNTAGYADEPSYQLLKEFHDTGVLNKSLLVFFSDHGIRFGPIRETYIGKFEERMPFIYLLFPSWFLQKYPQLAKNLRKNQKRLTTPFDIHATLVHLLNPETSYPSNDKSQLGTIGLSLFNEIPENRTCKDAMVLEHWCPCQTHTKVSTTDSIVINAAEALIGTINDWLKPFYSDCEKLSVGDIIDARIGQANDVVLRFLKHKNDVIDRQVVLGEKTKAPADYLLTLKASPSGGIFEGTVRYDELGGSFKVLNDISRINRYGNQSICINDARIRKFCYCRPKKIAMEASPQKTTKIIKA